MYSHHNGCYIRGTPITNAADTWDCSAPAHTRGAASRMSEEEVDRLRTGERPHAVDIAEFHHLPCPILIVPKPA